MLKKIKVVTVTLLALALASGALALDTKTIRDIDRADTVAKLKSVADDITKSAATRTPKDFQEGTQIAAETNTYLLYILVKQNALIIENQEMAQTPEGQ